MFVSILAICLLAGPSALLACPLVYAISIGVTEGHSIKEIEESYDKGIQELDNLQTNVQDLADKTNEMIDIVKSDYEKLTVIQSQINDANLFSEGVIEVSFDIYFEPFKTSVTTLQTLCEAYLEEHINLVAAS